MKEIKIKDLRKIQLDILDEVVKYCNDNSLRYFLAYGTLIGAIQNTAKRFVPAVVSMKICFMSLLPV